MSNFIRKTKEKQAQKNSTGNDPVL